MNFIEGRFDSGGFRSGQFALPISESVRAAATADRDVILGVRPEDIHPSPASGEGEASRIAARVEVVEPVGNEQLLHMTVDGQPLVARFPSGVSVGVSEEIVLQIDPERVHMFDASTEQTLA